MLRDHRNLGYDPAAIIDLPDLHMPARELLTQRDLARCPNAFYYRVGRRMCAHKNHSGETTLIRRGRFCHL